jgi:hypothetical protein
MDKAPKKWVTGDKTQSAGQMKLTRFQTMHCRGEQVCSHRLQAPRPTAIRPVLPRPKPFYVVAAVFENYFPLLFPSMGRKSKR